MRLATPIYRSRFVLDNMRTIEEHIPLMETEELMAWVKDAAAGAGLIVFIASSFVLATHMAMFAA